jgi:hypothetical protein
VGAALFNLGVAAAYNYATPAMQESYRRNVERKAGETEGAEPDLPAGEVGGRKLH